MYTNTTQRTARLLVISGVVMCGFNAAEAGANDRNITIAVHVNSQGLDLSRPADARTFYQRLQQAAWVVCTAGRRADLVALDNPQLCYEKTLGNAIRSANLPLLTNHYLATHTLQQAAACGINMQLRAAAEQQERP